MSDKRKIEDLHSSSLSLPLTTTEPRFPSDGNVEVAMGSFGISFKSIETNGVSSCHFVLITGLINKKRFGYLSHRVTEYNSSDTKLNALGDIFRIILEDINRYNTIDQLDDQTSLNINDFQHLRMVIGGGVDDEKNLNRKYVMMLNDPTINLEEKFINEDYKGLYEKLKNNVIILPPVTYLLNNDNEDEDDDNEELAIDPPGLWVKFNCYSNILRVGLEWLSKISNEYPLAFTIVDLNKNDVKFEWTINTEKIAEQPTNPYVDLYELFGLSRILYYLRSCIITGRIQVQQPQQSLIYLQHMQHLLYQSSCPNIRKYSIDLLDLAQEGKLNNVLGHDSEIRQCIQILIQKRKNNFFLIEDSRVTETTILGGLAQRIVHQNVPDILPRRLFALNMQALIADTTSRNELEKHLRLILKDIENLTGNIILFITDLYLIFDAKQIDDVTNIINLLKLLFDYDKLHCIIGTRTLSEYRKYNETNPIFEEYFQYVLVKETSVNDCISILRGVKRHIESDFDVLILDLALVTAAELTNRYIPNPYSPEKTIDLIKEICKNTKERMTNQSKRINELQQQESELNDKIENLSNEENEKLKQIGEELNLIKSNYNLEKEYINKLKNLFEKLSNLQIQIVQAEQKKNLTLINKTKLKLIPELKKKILEIEYRLIEENKHRQGQLLIEVVGPDAIIEKVSRMTGIASSKLSKTENDRLLTLRDHLYKKIIGQNDAIDSVVKVIQNRARFGKPNKPIGLFLFLAKTLALELFDSTEKLISIDMNKYTTSNSIAQLFDSSFGKDNFSISKLFDFVDFKQNDQLLEGMRQQPYAVILFNQIEKVHPQFWNNLSQVLDHNHSLNEKHVNVDLTNTILIFKSNVGAQIILEKSENFLLTNVKFDGKISQTIKDFVVLHFPKNFIRHVNDIVFFQPLTYKQLFSIIQLQVISIEERFKEKNIKISLTNKAIQSILQKSYKLFSGVGPVKDHIEKHITPYLSTVVSHGHIRIDTDINDQYQLSIEK
ncbi:unnamed protein product [Rotaria sordida]|uniref:Clp ATPase C-terminal domain-containing protein n=1 Tax=Rotaria sordida TaxID=392033 RepID=A0A814F709_9BILA|nr:unnamed protein product [Rotaria sordida]